MSLLVEGSAACFRRPEFVNDLVTYDIIPPPVANRLVEKCMPNLQGSVRRIRVLNPIVRRWTSVSTARGIKRCQILVDVAYVLEVRTAFATRYSDLDQKALLVDAIAYLGLSDFPARASILIDRIMPSALEKSGTIDLGWMSFDLKNDASRSRDLAGERRPHSRYFRAMMTNGVVEVGTAESVDLAS